MKRPCRPVPLTIIDDGSLVGPVYHPGAPNQGAWQAGNAAASLLQAAMNVWNNLVEYLNSAKAESGYRAKLQFKAALCELKTLMDILPALHACVATQPVYDKKGLRPFISLSSDEMQRAGASYKLYNQARSRVQARVEKIRSGIGAHHADPLVVASSPRRGSKGRAGERQKLTWSEIADLWEDLELRHFLDTLAAIERYVKLVIGLPIFEWFRFEPDGNVRLHRPNTGVIGEGSRGFIQLMGPELAMKFKLGKLAAHRSDAGQANRDEPTTSATAAGLRAHSER